MIHKDAPPLVKRCFSDNGEHSHWELVDLDTGRTLWEEPEENARAKQPEAEAVQGAASAYVRKHASGGNLESAFKAGVAWLAPRTPVESVFRELRLAWFNAKLKSYPHEREWEDDDAEERRAKQNEEMKKKYDADTQAIIRGEKKCIAPGCANDLY